MQDGRARYTIYSVMRERILQYTTRHRDSERECHTQPRAGGRAAHPISAIALSMCYRMSMSFVVCVRSITHYCTVDTPIYIQFTLTTDYRQYSRIEVSYVRTRYSRVPYSELR